MKCSKQKNCSHPCYGKLPEYFESYVHHGLEKVMDANTIPNGIGDKISVLLSENLDAADFCKQVYKYSINATPPRKRLLDRVIVHKFEQYYSQIIERLSQRKRQKSQIGDLFDVIPRGECLDLFLSLIKDHCMGNEQIKRFSQEIEILTIRFAGEEGINWLDLYASEEYEVCMTELFSIVFHHLQDRKIPIPALNTKLNGKYHPERINKLLRYMSKLWLIQHHHYSI